jgi:predicted deacylase
MKWPLTVALATVALTSVAEAQTGSLFAGAAATRTSGFLEVPAGRDSGTRIPVTLIAGTHGSEVAPIIALQRVRTAVNPEALRGTLILVHVANMPSYLHRTIYRGPWDAKNLNRSYPGRADGTVSERIANVITSEVIQRADFLVDMHAGDGNESLRPYTYWSSLGIDARADSVSREMALAWGNDLIVIDNNRPRDLAASIYTQNTAHLRGKPSITTESGWLGVPAEEMIQRNVDGAMRLMRYLRMLPGEVQMEEAPVWLSPTQVLTSPGTGLWLHSVERGQFVGKGAVIGRLVDFFGDVVAEVKAPFDGVVLYMVATPAMSSGEPVAMLGAIKK